MTDDDEDPKDSILKLLNEATIVDELPPDAPVIVARADSEAAKLFDDNLEGTCSECGHAVVFRPYIPQVNVKICAECFLDRLRGGTA